MKRIVGLVALAATLVLPVATSAVGGDARGPRCADIVIEPSYVTFGTSARVDVTLSIENGIASCAGAVYTVNIYDEAGTQLLNTETFIGDGSWTFQDSQSYTVAGNPQYVCVSATSMLRGRTVDSAPDSGCGLVELDAGAPAGGGYG